MKVLKILALLALLGIGTCCAIPAFLPSDGWEVEVSTYVDAPPEEVFAQVEDLSKWSEWHTMWTQNGGALETEGEGEGATLEWNIQGSSGTLTIESLVPHEKITYTISMTGNAVLGEGSFEFQPDGDSTTVVWKETAGFVVEGEKIGGVSGYFARYMNLLMQKGLEVGYGENLLVLRDLLEGQSRGSEAEAEGGGSEAEAEGSGEN